MARIKGSPKTGGRTKGTVNKKTQSLIEICEKYNFDIFEAMIERASNPNDEHSWDALKEAAQYVLPKRKAIEHSGEMNHKLTQDIKEVKEQTKQERIDFLKELLEKAENEPE